MSADKRMRRSSIARAAKSDKGRRTAAAVSDELREAKLLTYAREGGMCGRCGQARADECQHRLARGMGGSTLDSTHAPSHLVWLCRACHLWAERGARTQAAVDGFVIFHGEQQPADIPILYRGTWALLDDVGTVHFTGELTL